MKILFIEDNKSISEGLSYAFRQEGYEVLSAYKLKTAEEEIKKNPDIIILDLMLPDGNGMDFFRDTIEPTGIPTIVLTAVDEEDSIVNALGLGAEDYVTKPFSTRELLARVKRVSGRSQARQIISAGKVKFDMDKMEVFENDKQVNFTSLEKKLLSVLFMNIGKTVTRDILIDKIWDWTGNDVYDHTVTVYFKRIREKLDSDIIKTVKGVGYRIDKE